MNPIKRYLYISFVECSFNYCCTIWRLSSNMNTYKLETKLQKGL